MGISFAHWLVVLSALIMVAGSVAYIRDTISGKTRPNLVTWSMWALAPLVGTAAAIASKAEAWTVVRIFLAGFLPLLVMVAALFNRKSFWKVTTFDLLCLVSSLAALIVWALVDSPKLAILLAAIGDGFAAMPTVVKAWRFPETETGASYIASLISVILVIPSIPEWSIANCAFQVHLVMVNSVLVYAVYRRRLHRSNPAGTSDSAVSDG